MFKALMIIVVVGAGCGTPKSASTTRPAPAGSSPVAKDELSRFRTLHRGMTIAQGRAQLGAPSRETGSSLSIDVYRLADGSDVWLGYAGSGGLIYVDHGTDHLLPTGE